MCKVGICGHFGKNYNLLNGQTIKTKILTKELKNLLGEKDVMTVDTYGWKYNPIALLIRCYLLMKHCDNIVILPARNGVKVFVPLFLFLNKIFHRKLHYVVIGGWLPQLLERNNLLTIKLKKFDGIYVETHFMIKALQKLGLQNIRYLPNFKRLDILKEDQLVYCTSEPYKLCTFSRVIKEKGIEDAINSVKSINDNLGRIVYTLDIYGQIDENYIDRFEKLIRVSPSYISYKGTVNYNESVQVLRNYFALLFPTYYKTEGIPGTIIDAYAAGLPVIASQWDSANEIIEHGLTGFIYDFELRTELKELLISIAKTPNKINDMKKNCLKKAEEFLPETIINKLIVYLQE
jgi:glycosyltransferase involved in cell wall biosynthesis